MRTLIALPLLAATFALTGCSVVDNSGGPPPAGDEVSFADVAVPSDFFCNEMIDDAAILRDAADVDAMLGLCFPLADIGPEAQQPWLDLLDALEPGELLLFATSAAGGCVGDAWIEAVHLDGEVLRPWILQENSAYGRPNVACTADWGLAQHLVRVSGAEAATSAELTIGVFNPELPGGPDPVVAL